MIHTRVSPSAYFNFITSLLITLTDINLQLFGYDSCAALFSLIYNHTYHTSYPGNAFH
uniref:Uncharacterized protein n=1 Tax=Anguilla anguilla TaxID=7936 RepID=A0A0E9RYQ0_ANGAN